MKTYSNNLKIVIRMFVVIRIKYSIEGCLFSLSGCIQQVNRKFVVHVRGDL